MTLPLRFWLSAMDALYTLVDACRRLGWHVIGRWCFDLYLKAVERASDCVRWP